MIHFSHGIGLGCIVFMIGLTGVLIRKNWLMILMSLELMLLASGMNFIFVSYSLGSIEGQIITLFILVLAAAEVTIGLAFAILLFKEKSSLNVSLWNQLKESL